MGGELRGGVSHNGGSGLGGTLQSKGTKGQGAQDGDARPKKGETRGGVSESGDKGNTK